MELAIVSTVPMAESRPGVHSVRGTMKRMMYTATAKARAWVQRQAWFVDVKKAIQESPVNVPRIWNALLDSLERCVKRAREWTTSMDSPHAE